MAEKIGNEMQTQGIKMKSPAIPTKVCRFSSHNCRLKCTYWNLLCMILQSWTKSVRRLHFLTHRKPTLRIWHQIDPSPHPAPPWSKMFSQEQKYSGCTSTLFFWGERGSMLSEQCFTGIYSRLKLDIKCGAYFLTLLSKIVDFLIIYCFLCIMVVPTTSDHQLHQYFLSLKSQELFSILQLSYLFK